MFDLTRVADWIQSNVLYVLFIIAAASVAIGAINKKVRDAMVTFGVLMLALVVVVVAKNIDPLIKWISSFQS